MGEKNDNTEKVNNLKEGSRSSLWNHVQKMLPFAIISLSRPGMDDQEKLIANSKLKDIVHKLGLGCIELKGGYVEVGSGSGSDRIDELSIVIPLISQLSAVKIGQTDLGFGPQDSILYCNGVDFLVFISTSIEVGPIGSITNNFNYDLDQDALPMAKSAVKEYFSMLAKGSHKERKISFIPENFQLMEMRQRRTKFKEGDWWDNFGFRIL
jgi:hypothetical protein